MGSSGATGTPDQALGTLAMDDDILASKGERWRVKAARREAMIELFPWNEEGFEKASMADSFMHWLDASPFYRILPATVWIQPSWDIPRTSNCSAWDPYSTVGGESGKEIASEKRQCPTWPTCTWNHAQHSRSDASPSWPTHRMTRISSLIAWSLFITAIILPRYSTLLISHPIQSYKVNIKRTWRGFVHQVCFTHQKPKVLWHAEISEYLLCDCVVKAYILWLGKI